MIGARRNPFAKHTLSVAWLALFASAGCSQGSAPTEPCRQVEDEQWVCGDFQNALGTTQSVLVSGRLVYEEPGYDPFDESPSHDLTQTEIPERDVELRLRGARGEVQHRVRSETDEEGYVSLRLDLRELDLDPGNYAVDVYAGEYWAASINARLMSPHYDELAIISDIDLTYLDTDFQSTEAIYELLEQTPEERTTLPAMEVVYQQLRRGTGGELGRPLDRPQ